MDARYDLPKPKRGLHWFGVCGGIRGLQSYSHFFDNVGVSLCGRIGGEGLGENLQHLKEVPYGVKCPKCSAKLTKLQETCKIEEYTSLNSKELDYLRSNFVSLYKLPAKVGQFTFKLDTFGRQIDVISKNTYVGYLEIDNGYYGRMPENKDYYAIVKFYCRFYRNSTGTNIEGIRGMNAYQRSLPSLEALVENVITPLLERFKNSF